MTETTVFDILLAVLWILVQVGIGYYLFDLTRTTRRALRVVGTDGDDARRLGVEKYRALRLGLLVVPLYLVVGLVVALQIHDLRLLLGPLVLLGQGVQLRNYRADCRLVREIARRIQVGEPVLAVVEPPVVEPPALP